MADTFLEELESFVARLENESPAELLARLNRIDDSDFEGVTDAGLARFGFGERLRGAGITETIDRNRSGSCTSG